MGSYIFVVLGGMFAVAVLIAAYHLGYFVGWNDGINGANRDDL